MGSSIRSHWRTNRSQRGRAIENRRRGRPTSPGPGSPGHRRPGTGSYVANQGLAHRILPEGFFPEGRTKSFRKDSFRKGRQNPSGRIPSGRAQRAFFLGGVPFLGGWRALFFVGACLFLVRGCIFLRPNPSGRISWGGRDPFACRGKWSPENPSGRILWTAGAQLAGGLRRCSWREEPSCPRGGQPFLPGRRPSGTCRHPDGILPWDSPLEEFLPGGIALRETVSTPLATPVQLVGRGQSAGDWSHLRRESSGSLTPWQSGVRPGATDSRGSGLELVVQCCHRFVRFLRPSTAPHRERTEERTLLPIS